MSVKKKTGIILLTAAAMVISGGCGKALVFDNEPQDTTGGNIISGIPLTESKVKPALSIPEQTGSHTTAVATAATKRKQKPHRRKIHLPMSRLSIRLMTNRPFPMRRFRLWKLWHRLLQQKRCDCNIKKNDNVPAATDNLPVNSYTALNYNEVKGVWIWYSELYPILTGKASHSSEAE